MFGSPEEHAANPPSSWKVVKAGPRLWHLTTKAGSVLTSMGTQRAAESGREEGFFANLYEKEGRWFRGEPVSGWKPYQRA